MRVLNCFKKYWLWLVLAFLLLYLIMLLSFGGDKWRSIEADVSTRVEQSLTAAGHQWAEVQTKDRGRDVLISGQAPSEGAKNSALEVAGSTTDARGYLVTSSVTWSGEVLPPVVLQSPDFSADINSQRVVLKGSLANQQQIDQLVRSAQQQFGADRVVNQLKVGKNLKEMNKLSQLFTGFSYVPSQLTFAGQNLTLNGETSTEQLKTDAGRLMASKLGKNYTISNEINVIKVVKPEPVIEEVQVVNNICQNDLTSLMESSTILFASSQARIKQQSFAVLDQVVSVLEQCPDAFIEVVGHTDNTGKRYNNLILSEKRAQAVVNYLVRKGADDKHLSAAGMGSTQPIADNKTPTGRAKNRRIEFKIK